MKKWRNDGQERVSLHDITGDDLKRIMMEGEKGVLEQYPKNSFFGNTQK